MVGGGFEDPPAEYGCSVPCYSPLTAYREPGGRVTLKQYRESAGGWLDRSFQLPCGQCIGCRIRKSREWAMRSVHEAKFHERNSFITLTYNGENLPGDRGLNVKHWQDFAKRVRKNVGKFRFLHCGEYGDRGLRPHYHALLFGLDFHEDRFLWKEERGNKLFRSPTLESIWGKGFCSIGSMSYQSAAYVARYSMKKVNGSRARERYRRISEHGEEYWVRPEYVTMSRRPGLGAEFFKKYRREIFPGDDCVLEGRHFRPPRFYDGLLDEGELEGIKRKRVLEASKHLDDLTPERLRSREVCAEGRLALLRRSLP